MNRYNNINITKTTEDSRLRYVVTKYPIIPLGPLDVYVYTTQGDRYDVMAQNYYNNSLCYLYIYLHFV